MKKLFYVEQDQLLRAAFDEVIKGSPWILYTLENREDFDFRLRDFAPDMLLIDVTLCQERIQLTTQIPVVYLGFKEELEEANWLEGEDLTWEKPLVVAQILQRLDHFVKA